MGFEYQDLETLILTKINLRFVKISARSTSKADFDIEVE